MAWRKCPFIVGQRYLVLRRIQFLNHLLKEGDIVDFVSEGYDAKGGVTRYAFKDSVTGEQNAWHVWDDDPEPIEQWSNLFELWC